MNKYKFLNEIENIEFNTSDLLIIVKKNFLNCYKNKYKSIGMIIKNPTYINKNYIGIYVIEGIFDYKYNININKLDDFINKYNKKNKIFYRKLQNFIVDNDINNNIYNLYIEIKESINNNHYINYLSNDNKDIDKNVYKNSLWCSSFIGYLYIQMNILDHKIPWYNLSLNDFTSKSDNLQYVNNTYLSNEYIRIV